ncbi:hypothetical protein [Streptomyces sp. ICBB 8177]|uniref:hypothetical protein n=1 Tax=Streptomyces sp. ICBB 8177 TaxID=563922 RepID=UPI00316ABC98
MDSAPHLLTEDRPEFERVLDQALRAAAEESTARGSRLNAEQLRTMALSAVAAISACAAPEYDAYQHARERLGVPSSTAASANASYGDGTDAGGRGSEGPAALAGSSRSPGWAGRGGGRRADPTRRTDGAHRPDDATAGGGFGDAMSGAGLFAVVAVLTPILAGTAAIIFLIVGYVLAAMSPQPAIAAPLRTAGWLFLAIAGAGILFGMVGLVLTALRDGSAAIHAEHEGEPAEVTAAREVWLTALRERGVLPFLREAMESGAGTDSGSSPGSAAGPGSGAAPVEPFSYDGDAAGGRRRGGPRPPSTLGYSRPGFSSPGGEHDDSGRPRFSSPDFSSPDFSSPDFGGSEQGRDA